MPVLPKIVLALCLVIATLGCCPDKPAKVAATQRVEQRQQRVQNIAHLLLQGRDYFWQGLYLESGYGRPSKKLVATNLVEICREKDIEVIRDGILEYKKQNTDPDNPFILHLLMPLLFEKGSSNESTWLYPWVKTEEGWLDFPTDYGRTWRGPVWDPFPEQFDKFSATRPRRDISSLKFVTFEVVRRGKTGQRRQAQKG